MVVTFIIVAYNAEKHLNNSLDSLLKQDYDLKKIEVILVDSCSLDKTKTIMLDFKKKYAAKFKRVVVLDNPKKILPCGWNVALNEAKGDAILRVDAHTTFPKDFIKKNVMEINKGENIVGGKCESIVLNDTIKEKVLLIAEESIFGAGIASFRREQKRKYVDTLAFAMYRKAVFDNVGLYNESLARTEDNEMHYRMRQKGYRFLLSPDIKSFRYTRSSFSGLLKQKYGNGKWIGITMYYSSKCFSLYHFIPLFFVLGIILCTILVFLNMPIFMYLLCISYFLFNTLTLILIVINNGFNIAYLLLPFIFLSLHLAYGIGTIHGLLVGPFYKRKHR